MAAHASGFGNGRITFAKAASAAPAARSIVSA
jgi:hypothetical protein